MLAATAIRLFSDSALLEASQQELRQVLAERPIVARSRRR